MKSSKIPSKIIHLSKIFVRSMLNIFHQCRHEQTKATHLPRLTLSFPHPPQQVLLSVCSTWCFSSTEEECRRRDVGTRSQTCSARPQHHVLQAFRSLQQPTRPGCPAKRPCLVGSAISCSIKTKENLSLISVSHHVRCAIAACRQLNCCFSKD